MLKRFFVGALLFLFAVRIPEGGAVDSHLQKRMESARRIVADCAAFTQSGNQLIAQMQKSTAEAKTLSGQARKYESKVAPVMQPLKGPKLAAAKKMFQADLAAFSQHARAYREHTESVRRQFGQCEASRRAYEANRKKYELHTDDFHMENIPPPHICIVMVDGMDGATMTEGKVRDYAKRMVEAELDLMKKEQRLANALKNSALIDQDVRKQHEVNLQEQALVTEFAQLQEEYRQLQVEKNALKSRGVSVPVGTVHGKVRKH
jgi:hypothetical protein